MHGPFPSRYCTKYQVLRVSIKVTEGSGDAFPPLFPSGLVSTFSLSKALVPLVTEMVKACVGDILCVCVGAQREERGDLACRPHIHVGAPLSFSPEPTSLACVSRACVVAKLPRCSYSRK